MNSIFMNSKSSETSYYSHELLLNLTNKIDKQRGEKSVPLSNFSISDTWKNIKRCIKTTCLKYHLQYRLMSLIYLINHILYEIFKTTLSISLKNMRQKLMITHH